MRFHRVIILKAVTSRGGFDTALPLENRDKSRKKVNALFLLNRLLE